MPPESEPADPNERFRERRHQARKRRHHRTVALVILIVAGAAIATGATVIGTRSLSSGKSSGANGKGAKKSKPKGPRPLPAEVRGVHVTMALASLPGKLDEYLQIPGLNTVELDVKDENGEVGFLMPGTLAGRIGAAKPYYRARRAAHEARKAGAYLIGRVVVFEDPVLSEARPSLAIRRSDGSVWTNYAGLGWANPYDRRVWDYNISIAQAAARAGFDEIQFDYVRFPSDGPIESAVFAHQVDEGQGRTIARFVRYAAKNLKPLHVRVSVDVFGLSATHDLGIGQVPRRLSRYVDAVYPMVYPSHYSSGEYSLDNPSAVPGTTVARSLRDFRRALRGRRAKLIPWLEDFSLGPTPRTPAEVRAQIRSARRYHAKGFLLWNAGGIYTQEVLRGTTLSAGQP